MGKVKYTGYDIFENNNYNIFESIRKSSNFAVDYLKK